MRLSGLEGVEQLQQAFGRRHHHRDAQHERADRALVVGVEDDQLLHLIYENKPRSRRGKQKQTGRALSSQRTETFARVVTVCARVQVVFKCSNNNNNNNNNVTRRPRKHQR